MELHFDDDYVSRLVTTFYKDEKNMDVLTKITLGRVRHDIDRKKLCETCAVIHYDIDEIVLDEEGKTSLRRHTLDESEFHDIIKAMLLRAGFEADKISLSINPNNPLVFGGIDVLGKRVEKEKGHSL